MIPLLSLRRKEKEVARSPDSIFFLRATSTNCEADEF